MVFRVLFVKKKLLIIFVYSTKKKNLKWKKILFLNFSYLNKECVDWTSLEFKLWLFWWQKFYLGPLWPFNMEWDLIIHFDQLTPHTKTVSQSICTVHFGVSRRTKTEFWFMYYRTAKTVEPTLYFWRKFNNIQVIFFSFKEMLLLLNKSIF